MSRALAVPPTRIDGAWYLTGLTGGVGAAVAAGLVLGLDETRMLWAMGIAVSRAAGLREAHGTMSKNLVAGCAAADGVMAALLAQQGLAGPETPIEGSRGLGKVVAEGADYTRITAGLGRTWELMRNAYKPFPSGIVTHAAITAALELVEAHALAAEDIAEIRLTVHPLCLELCGRRTPKDAVEGTFSVYHWVAVALKEKAIGIRHFSDATVADPAVVALRDRVTAEPAPGFRKDEAAIEVVLYDGTRLRRHVAHARGAIERPPSDAELTAKLVDLADPVLAGRAGALAEACWRLESAPRVTALIAAATGC